MPSRRPHTKTRHGCASCKARRKRCDLERPVCQNCARTGNDCTYPDQAPAAGQPWYSQDDSSSSRSPPWLLREHSLSSPPMSTIKPEALELMHQYAALTCFTMSETPEHQHIWQILVPRLSFSHSYLLHGILSLAALHRHHGAKSEERLDLISQAREHQQNALSVYIQHLQNINEGNCHAMFIYSMILGGICYAFIREAEIGSQQENIIDTIIAAFNTLIGATVVAVQARHWLHQGEFKPLMTPMVPYDRCVARLSPSSKAAIDHLLDSLSAAGATTQDPLGPSTIAENHETYTVAIRALTVAFPQADGSLSSLSDVVSWPVVAGTAYLALLKQKDPSALLILAYYGVTLHYSNRLWFLQGLGARLVQAIAEKIGEPWLQHIEWAQQQVSFETQDDNVVQMGTNLTSNATRSQGITGL